MLAMLSTLAPGRADASSRTIASRFRCQSVLVQSEMEKNIFPLVKIQPLRGGDFLGMRIHRPMPVSRSFALAR